MIVELIDFEPNEFTIRKKIELIKVLSLQDGYKNSRGLEADCKLLGVCSRCIDGVREYERAKYGLCWDCKTELNS